MPKANSAGELLLWWSFLLVVIEAPGDIRMVGESSKGKRVLVVEDEPAIARVCVRTLTAEGFEVDIAVNGKVAHYWLDKNMYDLCLVDIRTPEMNGMELYRQLQEDCSEMTNRVIFTTGDVINANVKVFLEETGRPFLAKLFTPEELRSVVRAAWALSSQKRS
jgi:DNA-binding response OmpR family regulator